MSKRKGSDSEDSGSKRPKLFHTIDVTDSKTAQESEDIKKSGGKVRMLKNGYPAAGDESDFVWIDEKNQFPFIYQKWMPLLERGLYCSICQKAKKAGHWSKLPYKVVRATKVFEHVNSKDHIASVKATSGQGSLSFGTNVSPQDEAIFQAWITKFDCIYTCCVEEIANSKFESLQKLVERAGVKVQDTFKKENAQYISREFVTEAIQVMSDLIRLEICDSMSLPWLREQKELPKLSLTHGPLCLISDDCQDITVKEQMAIVVRGVVNGRVTERFLSLVPLPTQEAKSIHSALVDWRTTHVVSTDRVVALGSDGVSAWTGANNGVAALWRKEQNALTQHVHCTCHKIALIAKNAATNVRSVAWFFECVDSLHGLFCQSSPRTELLINIQKQLGARILKVLRSAETRWLSRDNACRTLYEILPSLMCMLISDAYNKNCADKAKVPGLRDALMDWEFIATLSLACDALPVLARCQKLFQAREMNWFEASKELPTMRAELLSLKETNGHHMVKLPAFIETLEKTVHQYGVEKCKEIEALHQMGAKRPRNWGAIELEFRRFQVEQDQDVKAQWEQKTRKAWMQNLVDEFDSRFPHDAGIVKQLHRLFCIDHVPILAADREEELVTVYKHFRHLDALDNVSLDLLKQQYVVFCMHMAALKKQKDLELKETADYLENWLNSFTGKSCPALLHLIKIALVMPVTSAEAERVFSAMKRIKSARRGRMTQRMLNNLLTLSLHGKDPELFNFPKAVMLWYKQRARKETLGVKFVHDAELNLGITNFSLPYVTPEPDPSDDASESSMDTVADAFEPDG